MPDDAALMTSTGLRSRSPTGAARVRRPALAACASLACVALVACDSVERALDCIDDDRPQFSRYELPSPVLNQVYDESVFAEINNTAEDDAYSYRFTLDGELPPGLTWRVAGRRVAFEGTAIELGSWEVTLGVRVEDGPGDLFDDGDASTLCRTTRNEPYAFVVVEG